MEVLFLYRKKDKICVHLLSVPLTISGGGGRCSPVIYQETMKPRYFFGCILLLALIALASCHRKDRGGEVKPNVSCSKEETVTFSQEDVFDFLSLDTTSYYMGEVGETECLVKMDSICPLGVYGRYFRIDSSDWTSPVRFGIRYEDGAYRFRSGETEYQLKFELNLSPIRISGTFGISSFLKFDSRRIFLEKYTVPFFTTYASTLNMFSEKPQKFPLKIHKDIIYGHGSGYWVSNPEHEEKYLKIITKSVLKSFREKELDFNMDVYVPQDSLHLHPLIVFIHGGAFYIGDKGAETMTTWCRNFAQLGYVTASINYRMGFKLSKTSIQQCGYRAIQDARAALRYLVAHAAAYGIDTANIFLAGTSAGSITALGAAFWTEDNLPPFVKGNGLDTLCGNLESSGNELKNTFNIKALANMWGAVYDLDELNGKRIPVISFHGTADNLVPYNEGTPFSTIGERLFDRMYGSYAMHERLDALEVPNEFYPIEGAQHAPYQDKKGRPNDCYYFIQEHMLAFFNRELLRTGNIVRDREQIHAYSLQQKDVARLHWKAEGGFILRCEGQTAYVVWRKDMPQHRLTASGLRENGAAFTQSIQIK